MSSISRAVPALALALISFVFGHQPAHAEGFTWQNATPESQGMSREKLEAIRAILQAKKTKAFLVARNDNLVYEWYADDHGPTKPHGTASLAKAIVGGLSLAVAMTDGKISLDDPAAKFVPQWKDHLQKSQILVRHLGSHTSGIEDAEADMLPHEQLTGWKGDFWKRLNPPHDPFTVSRDQAPLLFEPGEKLQYSNPGIGMLTYCVTAAIQGGEDKDIRALLKRRLMQPIGVPDPEWSCGYNKTFSVEGLPLVGSWGGGNYSARASASIGRLMLREGDWDGQRLLSPESVRLTTGTAGLPGACGMGWWTNASGRYPKLPKDAYWGAGAGDQLLLVVPSLNLIMVRNGQTLTPGPGEEPVRPDDVFTRYHDYRARILLEPLIEAASAVPAAGRAEAPARQQAPSAPLDGKLSLQSDDHAVSVTSSQAAGWKAVVDRRRGGVITQLHIPASGPNIVSNDGSRFEGLCNTIYVDFKETGRDGAYVAKGSLYYFGTVSQMRVMEHTPDRVVVEVEGVGGNQVMPKADVCRYRQRYVFLPDRIQCAGELDWLLDNVVADSHPELIQLQCLFAPGTVAGELKAWTAARDPIELPQTNSKGKSLPTTLDYPLTIEVPLQGGSAISIRSLELPSQIIQARYYWNEFPRQIENKRGFAFKAWEGWPGNGPVRFGKDELIKYRYEITPNYANR
jgi:CubicO group peptidase (beta-lactamase class C family)